MTGWKTFSKKKKVFVIVTPIVAAILIAVIVFLSVWFYEPKYDVDLNRIAVVRRQPLSRVLYLAYIGTKKSKILHRRACVWTTNLQHNVSRVPERSGHDRYDLREKQRLEDAGERQLSLRQPPNRPPRVSARLSPRLRRRRKYFAASRLTGGGEKSGGPPRISIKND